MASNRREHLRYRYGICLNDQCPKCKSKEVQQIPARKDFVCEECKKPLRECPPPKSFWDKYGKMITIAVALLVIGIAILLYIMLSPGTPKGDYRGPQTGPDTASVTEKVDTPKVDQPIDTLTKAPTDTAAGSAEPKTESEKGVDKETAGTVKKSGTDTPVKPGSQTSSIRVPFGKYSGPANGLDGEIRVTSRYTLDLRNAAHETIELQPGDVITKTKFKNGELVGGFWHRGSEGRSFHR